MRHKVEITFTEEDLIELAIQDLLSERDNYDLNADELRKIATFEYEGEYNGQDVRRLIFRFNK